MALRTLTFYATELDLHVPLCEAEKSCELQYIRVGIFESNVLMAYLSHTEIPNFGHATHRVAIANPFYLIAPRETEIHTREVPRTDGSVHFAVDQMVNADTIVLRPGGIFSDDVILSGTIGAISQSRVSRRLYNLILRAFRRHFRNYSGALVGPEAKEKWDFGVRLTIGAFSPREFDLQL